jgi:hypothetical protein
MWFITSGKTLLDHGSGVLNIKTQSCPPSDEASHIALVKEMMGDFRKDVAQGRVTGLFYFAWNSDSWQKTLGGPWNLDRCGEQTQSGRLAIAPM